MDHWSAKIGFEGNKHERTRKRGRFSATREDMYSTRRRPWAALNVAGIAQSTAEGTGAAGRGVQLPCAYSSPPAAAKEARPTRGGGEYVQPGRVIPQA